MKIKHMPLLMFIFLCSFFFIVTPALAQQEALKIKSIEVKGNSRVEESTIRFHIKSKVGDSFSVSQLRDDLKGIYELGFFKDVKVDVKDFEGGLKIVFVVFEKPSIHKIIISGNTKIKTGDIEKELTIKENIIFNRGLLKESKEKIKVLYQTKGHLFAEVETHMNEIGENMVDVEFRINEGQKMSIDKITFTGNKSFSEETLRKVLLTKEESIFSFITKRGTYIKELLNDDIMRIQEFYYNHGYIMAHVGEPRVEIDRGREKIYVTIPVIEGDQFMVGKIDFKGDPDISEEEMRKELSLKEGEVFKRSGLREDIGQLSELYSRKGYALVDIGPHTKTDSEKKVVNVTYDIDKGKRMFVGNISILGNEKTRDNVIRREFKLSEGEVFDSEKLRKSKRAIDFSGFFSDVEIDTEKGDKDDIIDIKTRVKEMDTGAITFGGGYSSVENLIIGASISQNNLFGRGQNLTFATYLSSVNTQFRIDFTDPAIFDSAVGMRVGLFNLERDFLWFDKDSWGGNLGFFKKIRENTTGFIGYKYEDVDVTNIEPGITSVFIRSQEGNTKTSSLTPRITRDTRNRKYSPSAGSVSYGDLELAGGPLGGTNDFWKTNVAARKYITLWKEKKLVFSQRGSVGIAQGYSGDALPIYERFFAGGTNTLRGYEYHEVGPTVDGEAIGGESRFLLSSELRYPLLNQMNFTGILFLDAGNVYDKISDLDPFNLRSAVGPGIRFFSPIGPMGFEYGIKINPKPGESSGEFHFRVGAGF